MNNDRIDNPMQLIQPLGVATRQSTDVVVINGDDNASERGSDGFGGVGPTTPTTVEHSASGAPMTMLAMGRIGSGTDGGSFFQSIRKTEATPAAMRIPPRIMHRLFFMSIVGPDCASDGRRDHP